MTALKYICQMDSTQINCNPNSILIGSALFAGLTIVTDRPKAERPQYSICNNILRIKQRGLKTLWNTEKQLKLHTLPSDYGNARVSIHFTLFWRLYAFFSVAVLVFAGVALQCRHYTLTHYSMQTSAHRSKFISYCIP